MGDLRWMGKAAGRGAYAIPALPDLLSRTLDSLLVP